MCSAEGALIEPGKTKTSNHFALTVRNHLYLRFTVLSLATKTFFCISCKYMLCTIFMYLNMYDNALIKTILIVKNFNYFSYKIVLFLLFLF